MICLLVYGVSHGQPKDTLNNEYYKNFITRMEIFVGASVLYSKSPYDFAYAQNETKSGYCFGLGLVHRFNSRFEVAGNLYYDRKGITNVGSPPGDASIKLDVTNDYLIVSLIPSMTLNEESPFKFGIGLYFGYLIGSKTKITVDSLSGKRYYFDKETTENYYKYDVGLSIAVAYSFLIKRKEFFLRIVNNNGFLNINRTPFPSLGSIDKNNNVTFSVGFNLNNKGSH